MAPRAQDNRTYPSTSRSDQADRKVTGIEGVRAMRAPVILDVNPAPEELQWEQDWLQNSLEIPVVKCLGPHGPGKCPLLRGKPCGKIAKADGVLFQLDLDLEEHRELLGLYAEQLDIPIRVVVSKEQRIRYADLLSDVEVVTPPVGPATLDAFAAEVQSELD
jgi:hypothetical protein